VEALLLALRSIRRNLLRSFLTILGIVIGVSAVITMVTLGNGATQAIRPDRQPGQQPADGDAGPAHRGRGRWRRRRRGVPQFTEADAEAIAAQIGGVAAVAPQGRASVTVVANGRNWSTSVTGSTNDWFTPATGSWPPAAIFEPDEQRAGAAVCMIGETVRASSSAARRSARPAWASQLRIKQFSCEVIGILAAKGQAAWATRTTPWWCRCARCSAASPAAARRQHAAGVDEGRQPTATRLKASLRSCCASGASWPTATTTTSTSSTPSSWPRRCPAPWAC
jgi:hypothetical protein